MSDIAISARGLGKAYSLYGKPQDRLKQMLFPWRQYHSTYWALRGLNLEVRRGETVGVIGRNGSGKSTFLQMVAGVLQPTEGAVETHGRMAALLTLGAGFNPEFTGRENVYLAAAVLGLTDAEISARYEAILEFAGIGDFIEQPVKRYSAGMGARLAFAVAAHVDADILIVDEVLSVGDAAFAQKCMRFVQRFKQNGTLFFVSHDVGAVLALCERAVWIDRGELRESGPAEQVCRAYTLASVEESEAGAFKIGGSRKAPPALRVEDPRAKQLAESTLRNDIAVFDFDPDAEWHGHRGASVTAVDILDETGQRRTELLGGEVVDLVVHAQAHQPLASPIVGFFIKDRLGQPLFGDNTHLIYRDDPLPVAAEGRFQASFRFQMPYLQKGDYAVTVAVVDGTQDEHIRHHWIDDALFFQVTSTHVARGMIGIPMLDVRLAPE